MPRFKGIIDIDAPRDHVFALAADVSKHADWTTFIKETVITGGDGKSAGTTDKRVIKVGPQRNKLEDEWIEYSPGESFARRFTGYFKGEERITLSQQGNATHVEWAVNYTPPFGIIGKFGALFMMARIFQNEIEASLENLKRELEI